MTRVFMMVCVLNPALKRPVGMPIDPGEAPVRGMVRAGLAQSVNVGAMRVKSVFERDHAG